VLYDTENGREFSDAIRIVIINLPMLEPKNIGISAEFYENLLFLLKQISEDMNTVDELIEQIDCRTDRKAGGRHKPECHLNLHESTNFNQ